MIARVPNRIRTHKRASVTNFVAVAMASGFSAPTTEDVQVSNRYDIGSDYGLWLLFKSITII